MARRAVQGSGRRLVQNGTRRRFTPPPALAIALAAAVLSLLSCARPFTPAAGPVTSGPLARADDSWVQATMRSMTLEQRVGQMLMARVDGRFDNVRSADMRETQRLMADSWLGGFYIDAGSPLSTAAKLNELQSRAALPLLVAADRAPGTVFPVNMGLAATGDASAAELAGRITAAEARAVGIHWLFAPVIDVNGQPGSHGWSSASFGSHPLTVGAFATAWIQGATAGGALTAAGSFPGAGDTRFDSVAGFPVAIADSATLDARELRVARAAIFAGVPAIRLGHIALPAMTGGMTVPATLSHEITTGLLRSRLGFRGLIVTDAMNLPSLRSAVTGYSPGEVAVRAVEAGADVILTPSDPLMAHRAIVDAVRSGRIHYSRLDSSVVRILRAKAGLGLHLQRLVPLDSITRKVASPEHEIVAADIAARALTLASDSAGLLPLDPRRVQSVAVVALTAAGDVRAGEELVAELARIYGRAVSLTRIDRTSNSALHDTAAARAQRSDATILATFYRDRAGEPPMAHALAHRLGDVSTRLMVVSFGDPVSPSTLPGASTYMLAWQTGEAAQRAAARGIAGRTAVPGHLPIDLTRAVAGGLVRPARAYGLDFATPDEVGMDAYALERVDSIIAAGIVEGAAPGVAVAIGRHGRLVRLRGFGTVDRRRGYGSVTDSTIFDMASITKVMATTTALMMLVDDGRLALTDTVARLLPEWRGVPQKSDITISNLLQHNSGLPAYAALWRELSGREEYRRRIMSLPLQYEPGTRTVYSDLGVILLALIVEQVSGMPLDVFIRERLTEPLGMRDTGFNPLQWPYASLDIDGGRGEMPALPDPLIHRIAPTEVDTVFRMRHVRGQVHDENAFAIGGVAGHAGLFSSARDMAIFAQMMMNRGFYGGRRYIDPETVELFTRRADPSSSRALGWDTPEGQSSAGRYFTETSFGHTGFTGPSIWIDPERDVFVVLLMNRVNPTRENQRHLALRREVADAVQRAIIDMPVTPRLEPVR